jgi:undecaprenyl-diphosphatase
MRPAQIAAGVLTWSGFAGVLIGVGELVVHSSALTAMDHNITTFVVTHRTPALNSAMRGLTWVGSWVALLVTAAVTAILSYRQRVPVIATVLVIVAWAGELGAVTLAKTVVGRQRPPADLWLVSAHGQSFPSGHTANAFVTCTAVALLVSGLVRTRPARLATWTVAVLLMGAVGFSRVELGVHWTTDVAASALFVTGWLLVVRRWLHQHVREAVSPAES